MGLLDVCGVLYDTVIYTPEHSFDDNRVRGGGGVRNISQLYYPEDKKKSNKRKKLFTKAKSS